MPSTETRSTETEKNEPGSGLLGTILILPVFIVILLIIIPNLAAFIGYKNEEKTGGVSGNQENSPAPSTESLDSPASAVDSIPFGLIFLSLLAVAVIIGIIWLLTFSFKKVALTRNIESNNMTGWQTLVDRHAKILGEWMSYETDIVKMIDFPLLSDMSEPATIKLHEALRNASMYAPKDVKSMRHIEFAGSDYDTAVRELDIAFRAAESKARLSSWNKFTMEEKKRLQRAKDLLAMAMNTASTSAERQSSYKQAMKALQGLIEVPKATILALESSTQLALTA